MLCNKLCLGKRNFCTVFSDPQDTSNMSFDSTQLMAQMAELRNNREDADVTLNCQGELIKAHSFILGTRYVC